MLMAAKTELAEEVFAWEKAAPSHSAHSGRGAGLMNKNPTADVNPIDPRESECFV